MKFDKEQKEWLAFELYRRFCEKRDILTYEKRESPDFVIKTEDSTIGLEVTESITEVFARISDFLKLDNMIEELRPEFIVQKGEYRAKIYELIDKKARKLNQIYKVYNENKIFILAPFSFLSETSDFSALKKDINIVAKSYNIIYDEIYIFTGKFILTYRNNEGNYSYYFSRTDKEEIKSIILEISQL